MEQNSNDELLYSQMREEYGKVVYSYTTHLKDARIIENKNNLLKILNIVLSAISTCGLIAVLLEWNTKLCGIITTILTTLLLILSTYLKSACLDEKIISHRNTSHMLWLLREQILSYLTDFNLMSYDEKVKKREKIIVELSKIYSNELITSNKAYSMAQKDLKENEEQFFTDDEIDIMLPAGLRKKNSK